MSTTPRTRKARKKQVPVESTFDLEQSLSLYVDDPAVPTHPRLLAAIPLVPAAGAAMPAAPLPVPPAAPVPVTAGMGRENVSPPSSAQPDGYETDDDPVLIPAPNDVFPGRYRKQAPTEAGFRAYVVFNGISPGVFYNWNNCKASIAMLSSHARSYKGYATYEEAHAAWRAYKAQGLLPPGFPRPTAAHIAEASDKEEIARTLTGGRPVDRQGAGGSASIEDMHPPAPLPPTSSARGPSAPPSAPSGASASALPVSIEAVDIDGNPFGRDGVYIVYEGVRPGVYARAETAKGALGPVTSRGWLVATGANEAYEIFGKMCTLGLIRRIQSST